MAEQSPRGFVREGDQCQRFTASVVEYAKHHVKFSRSV
jgi:hypothetical protein